MNSVHTNLLVLSAGYWQVLGILAGIGHVSAGYRPGIGRVTAGISEGISRHWLVSVSGWRIESAADSGLKSELDSVLLLVKLSDLTKI